MIARHYYLLSSLMLLLISGCMRKKPTSLHIYPKKTDQLLKSPSNTESIHLDNPLTLEQTIAFALAHSPIHKAQKQNIAIEQSNCSQAATLANPYIEIAGVTHKEDTLLSDISTQVQFNVSEMWQAKHRVKAAQNNYHVVSLTVKQQELDLISAVSLAYLTALYGGEKRKNNEKMVEQYQKIVDLSHNNNTDALTDKKALYAAKRSYMEARSAEQQALIGLSSLLGLSTTLTSTLLAENFNDIIKRAPHYQSWSCEDLIIQATTHRPDIQAAHHKIKSQMHLYDYECSRTFRDILLGVTYSRNNENQHGIGAIVDCAVPFFDTNNHQCSKMKHLVTQANNELSAAQITLATAIRTAYEQVAQTQTVQQLYAEEIIPTFTQLHAQTHEELPQHRAYLELLLSQQEYLDIQFDMIKSLLTLSLALGKQLIR